MTQLLEQDYELVPVDKLTCHPANPRQGDVDAITDSMAENGFYGTVVAQRATGHVLVGNHRLLAARQQGLAELPVMWVDVDDDRARRILLVDNRSNDRAGYDTEALVRVLGDLAGSDLGLAGTGYSDDDLAALLSEHGAEPATGLTDPDAIPEPPVEPVSKPGDLWLLGPHRLLCGDSTSGADVARVMDGQRAMLLATDPPYLVDYDGSGHPQSQVNSAMTRDKAWDEYKDPETSAEFYVQFLTAARDHALADRAPVYQWHADLRRHLLMAAWETVGLLAHQTVIWAKGRPVLTRSDFMWQHEPCLYGWVKGKRPDTPRRPPANEHTLWQINQQGASNDIHPTEKPVELFARPIGWHTRVDEVCYEPFSGSGSQIIACHMLRRACYAVEIAPQYVDVACRRYQEHTGTLPVLEATGQPHDFTDEETSDG